MCGRYLAYANVPRICRACDVTPEESDDPYHECRFLSMSDLNAKSRLALGLYKPKEYGLELQLEGLSNNEQEDLKIEAHNNLKQLSQHMHINAFEDVWLGSNTYGLLESLPHDMIHAFLHGVLMYVIEVIMSPLNPTEKYKLDKIVDEIVVPVRSSVKKHFPRCSFSRGITNLSLLTADERAGVAFVLALVAASRPGSEMLRRASTRIDNARQKQQKVNAEMDEDCNLIDSSDEEEDEEEEDVFAESLCVPENMLLMLEMLLAFHAWYKRGHPFSLKTNQEKTRF